jgi:hypothetical protein
MYTVLMMFGLVFRSRLLQMVEIEILFQGFNLGKVYHRRDILRNEIANVIVIESANQRPAGLIPQIEIDKNRSTLFVFLQQTGGIGRTPEDIGM